MSQEKNQKQSRRESLNNYDLNPQKSADPPQPQGKNRNNENNKQNNIQNNNQNNNQMK